MRRRQRRLRLFLRHERLTVAMLLAERERAPHLSTRTEAGQAKPRPQERVPRHTVEQLADFAPMVQIIDVPVPQWWTNWWTCSGSSMPRSPSRLSQCPRSLAHPVLFARLCRHADGGTVGGSANGRVGPLTLRFPPP